MGSHLKSSNHLYTELNYGYLTDTKFCLESMINSLLLSGSGKNAGCNVGKYLGNTMK